MRNGKRFLIYGNVTGSHFDVNIIDSNPGNARPMLKSADSVNALAGFVGISR